ncbi:hypothetical protein BC936DRAFT_137168 [Jimgerdemannia flammicorona]|uniref:Uncharacterized protein n=1 Tax=Jimgerdemannia flammicorona TaxID=994334 RepID=A0A433DJ70_9FUNG|nr:hypothetical protein BC936DRAFT_137168 [Jimgerdemannia flammicorona]
MSTIQSDWEYPNHKTFERVPTLTEVDRTDRKGTTNHQRPSYSLSIPHHTVSALITPSRDLAIPASIRSSTQLFSLPASRRSETTGASQVLQDPGREPLRELSAPRRPVPADRQGKQGRRVQEDDPGRFGGGDTVSVRVSSEWPPDIGLACFVRYFSLDWILRDSYFCYLHSCSVFLVPSFLSLSRSTDRQIAENTVIVH